MISDKNYFDHDADIGIIGYGNSLEHSFINAAKAMFALMTDLDSIKPLKHITFSFEEEDNEFAFVEWLNRLIALAQKDNLVFFEFKIQRSASLWECEAIGETWRDDLERRIEVKGATLTMLAVTTDGKTWQAKCVVDV